MNNFQVSKSTVECYKIRNGSTGMYWADITIDAQGRGGRINISSDWGNWSNYWGAAGEDFKKFLGEINMEYAAEKFGAERWIDVKASCKAFRELVRERQDDESITKEEAKQLREEIKGLEQESYMHFDSDVRTTVWLYDFLYKYGDYVEYCYKTNGQFKAFWKTVWPVLLAEFERERLAVAA